jgi:hypothetical protein
MDNHESPAADVARARICNREGETNCDRRIDRVAAAIENLSTDAGGALFLRNNQGIVSDNCLRWSDGWRLVDRRYLC